MDRAAVRWHRRPMARRRLLRAMLLVLLLPTALLAAVLVEPGTLIAVSLGLVVFVPPLVLVWGETRGKPSVWGWAPPDSMDAELRRLLDDEA